MQMIPASTQGAPEHGQTQTGLKLKNPSESVTASGVGRRWKESDTTRTPSIGTRPVGVISKITPERITSATCRCRDRYL